MWVAHCGVFWDILLYIYIFLFRLCSMMNTTESNSAVGCIPRSFLKIRISWQIPNQIRIQGPIWVWIIKRGWKSSDTLPLRLNSADSTGRTLCRDAASLGSKFDKTRGIVTKTLLKPAPLIRGPRSIGEEKIQQQSILQDCFFKVVLACRCTESACVVL